MRPTLHTLWRHKKLIYFSPKTTCFKTPFGFHTKYSYSSVVKRFRVLVSNPGWTAEHGRQFLAFVYWSQQCERLRGSIWRHLRNDESLSKRGQMFDLSKHVSLWMPCWFQVLKFWFLFFKVLDCVIAKLTCLFTAVTTAKGVRICVKSCNRARTTANAKERRPRTNVIAAWVTQDCSVKVVIFLSVLRSVVVLSRHRFWRKEESILFNWKFWKKKVEEKAIF